MHVAPHMCKTITLKANAQQIITVKCIWHHICTKFLLWRQMLRKSLFENAFDAEYVQNCYFKGKCSGNHHLKMHVAPHMCKTVTLKAYAKEIVTLKCIWHQICTKSLLWRQMLKKIITWKCIWHHICTKLLLLQTNCSGNCYFKMHLTPNIYKIITFKANAKKIVTWKCMWHHICATPLLWRKMLRKSLL